MKPRLPMNIYFGDANLIEFNNDDEALNKIEELLLEGAIYDPIGFRDWHKQFKSYVEQKFIEEVENRLRRIAGKGRNKRN